jgi:hypothetical protein
LVIVHEGFHLVVDDEYVVLPLVRQRSGQVFGGFGDFCGVDFLTLAAHVSLLSLLRCLEEFRDIFDVDEWPGEIIAPADGLES